MFARSLKLGKVKFVSVGVHIQRVCGQVGDELAVELLPTATPHEQFGRSLARIGVQANDRLEQLGGNHVVSLNRNLPNLSVGRVVVDVVSHERYVMTRVVDGMEAVFVGKCFVWHGFQSIGYYD